MRVPIRYAAGSDVGQARDNNEDSAYAGPHLLAVADGMGGHVGGEIASSLVIETLAPIDAEIAVEALTDTLGRAVTAANEALARRIMDDPSLGGMGTTLTALLWSGPRLALAHIGDSRGYVLRDEKLFQFTEDHTLEQMLAAEAGESARHGSRLMRVLDGRPERVPDLSLREARPGDRYLLCSDGLSGPVSPDTLFDVLSDAADVDEAVRQLIGLANRAGGPDNVTVVVADVVDDDGPQPTLVVGAAGR